MWTKQFWKAVGERIIRGAAAGISAGYFAGDVVFDAFNVNTWGDIGSLAIGGAFSALVLSLIGNAVTGNGPALSKVETLDPPKKAA